MPMHFDLLMVVRDRDAGLVFCLWLLGRSLCRKCCLFDDLEPAVQVIVEGNQGPSILIFALQSCKNPVTVCHIKQSLL